VLFAVLGVVAAVATAVLLPSSDRYFTRFYGATDPVLVAIVASLLGALGIAVLTRRFGFRVLGGRHLALRGVGLSAVLASVMAIAIVVADLVIRYPQNTNVPVPEALAFYPTIGFVAEIIFHVLPLALVLLALAPLERRLGRDRVAWLAILVVAISEPTFQVLFDGTALRWGDAYTWIHVFVFALLQLYVFRRFDFVSMYAFRLIYYAYWHIIWGVIRLELLF
jgi:hypothetical protein